MLTKWTLGNFKAISDKTTFSLGPITVLVGENSSGKSSVLQSILLMAQTLKATQSRQPLLLNGEFIRLGYLTDIIHNGQTKFPLEIGFELQPNEPVYDAVNHGMSKRNPIELNIKINLPEKNNDTQSSLSGILGYLQLKSGEEDTITLESILSKSGTLLDKEENAILKIPAELREDINKNYYDTAVTHIRFSRGNWLNKVEPYKFYTSLYHFLPNKILETYNAVQYSMSVALKAAGSYLRLKEGRKSIISEISSAPPVNVTNFRERLGSLLKKEISDALFSQLPTGNRYDPSGSGSSLQYLRMASDYLDKSLTLENWLKQVKLEIPTQHARTIGDRLIHRATVVEKNKSYQDSFYSDLGVRIANLPDSLADIRSQVIDYFSQHVYYLGPLREDPRFIYTLPPYPELTHVGLKGEFTASVLEKYKNQEVEYPLPPTGNGQPVKIGRAKLIEALSQWLEHMGLLENVTTKDRGKIGTELSVHAKGVDQDLDLTSIGVGVSQILPTLVMGLIAPKGTTFLLEQPELHLHPKVQSIVADFLLGLAKLGKQCIVETHSEYLVSRLRLRVAEDESNLLASQTSIYFVERFNGKSSFRKLDLNQYGALLEWPEGFMDQGPNESELIMKAALKKRKQSQASK